MPDTNAASTLCGFSYRVAFLNNSCSNSSATWGAKPLRTRVVLWKGVLLMDEMNHSPPSFFSFPSNSPVLSEAWLKTSLEEPDWEYRLLTGVMVFIARYTSSLEALGTNHVLRFSLPVNDDFQHQLVIFLDACGRLTRTHPELIPQKPSQNIFVLIARP
jgi:hypothetical protein